MRGAAELRSGLARRSRGTGQRGKPAERAFLERAAAAAHNNDRRPELELFVVVPFPKAAGGVTLPRIDRRPLLATAGAVVAAASIALTLSAASLLRAFNLLQLEASTLPSPAR